MSTVEFPPAEHSCCVQVHSFIISGDFLFVCLSRVSLRQSERRLIHLATAGGLSSAGWHTLHEVTRDVRTTDCQPVQEMEAPTPNMPTVGSLSCRFFSRSEVFYFPLGKEIRRVVGRQDGGLAVRSPCLTALRQQTPDSIQQMWLSPLKGQSFVHTPLFLHAQWFPLWIFFSSLHIWAATLAILFITSRFSNKIIQHLLIS